MEPNTPWRAISDTDYRTAVAKKPDDSIALLTELIPDLGKARSARTIASRMFYGIAKPLSEKFNGHWYFNDTGLESGKYIERLYLQHVATGDVFCLGTYFFSTWRIWGPERLRPRIAELCQFVGIPFPTPEILKAYEARMRTAYMARA